jgi:mono/diheme cytochrome c family protein
MRIKTLGVVLMTAMALFTAFYWLTDASRRENAYETQIAELVAYGEEMFGPNTPENDHTANCAGCHGADGTGGQVGNTGRTAPNLHSKSIYEKLKAQAGGSFTEIRKPGDPPDYVNLVIRFGGVVVSGDVNSPMPAWSTEVGGALTVAQIDALTALVETWALEAGSQPDEEVPNTVEAGQKVYTDSGCGGCHGADLAGVPGTFPDLRNIGNEPVTDLPTPISHLDELKADYLADDRMFLERWIRDSAVNYNDGVATGMPVHPVGKISESAMEALITFLLSQKQ